MGEPLHLQDAGAEADPQALAARYAELIRQQPLPNVDPIHLPDPRRALRVAAVIGAIGLYTGVVLIMLRPTLDPDARVPAGLVDLGPDEACAQRQATLMHAIAAYRRDTGALPAALDRLVPRYLAEPATDPVSGRAYDYTIAGDAVVVACPEPHGHS